MRTILVTGATGFIGKRLVIRLHELGFRVVEASRADGDIVSPDIFSGEKFQNIDHVVHLAGKVFVPDSWQAPLEFQRINTLGTANVLEYCRSRQIPLTYISSYLYGEPKYLPIDEMHPLRPFNPYALSKYNAENICRFYAEQFDLSVTVVRPFNIYGPDQRADFLISKIVSQILDDGEVELENLTSKRDYLHVDDFIEALIACINLKDGGLNIFNIGSGRSWSVMEIVDFIRKNCSRKIQVKSKNIIRQNDVRNVFADTSRAQKKLNWNPHIGFEEGVLDFFLKEAKNKNKFIFD
jgi:nucleoside-diphosphate-sugar epimerase